MKRVITSEVAEAINVNDVPFSAFIFAKKDTDKIEGVVIKENQGWILKISSNGSGCCGWHESRQKLLDSASTYGYTFFTEAE